MRQVSSFTPLSEITTAAVEGTTELDQLAICFTPLGRSFMTTNADGVPTTPMVGARTITVERTPANGGQGIVRTVAILPNGMARVAL